MEFNTDMDAVSHKCLGKLQFYKVKFDQNRNNIPKMARCDCLWIRQSQLIIINFLWASENSRGCVHITAQVVQKMDSTIHHINW